MVFDVIFLFQLTAYYSRLRSLLKVINSVMSLQLFAFIACVLVYFTQSFIYLDGELKTQWSVSAIAFYMGCSLYVLCLSADATVQVS